MRFLKPRRRARVFWLVAITGAVAAAIVIPVLAIDSSTFDTADGNLTLDDVDNGAPTTAAGGNFDSPGDDDATDWQNAPNLTGAGVGTFPADLAKDADDNSFGQGTKEDSAVPTVTDGSIPPNKSDLINFYVSNEQVGTDAFLYLAWTRANTLGTVNMDFELNHKRCGLPPDPPGEDCTSNGITPVRSAGDILVTFDFSQGGDHVDLGLLKWVTTGANSQCEANGATTADGCWGNRQDLDQSGSADGAVNDGWTTFNPIANESLLERRFGEAGINLTEALDLGSTDCEGFASAYLKSRSSDSFTSAVKDFVAPVPVDINLCRPANISVEKTDSSTGAALAGATFELYRDNAPVGTFTAADSLITSCTTAIVNDPQSPDNGKAVCSLGQVSGTGTEAFIVREASAPPGYNLDPTRNQFFTVTFTTSVQNLRFAFSDPPITHRVIVLVCHEDTNTLVASNVTNGSETKTSLSGSGLTAAQQADLCGLGGARFTGKSHLIDDNYAVDIGQTGDPPVVHP